jgi:hypothetical protein
MCRGTNGNMSEPAYTHDVFLSHSAKDKAVVRSLAERLRADGLKVWFDEWVLTPGDSIPAKIEAGLEHSRVLVLCMSANAFGSDWAQLEAGTFRFRDPLNQERRFIPLRLDDAPIKGSLAQFLFINWCPADREHEYQKLLEACRPPAIPAVSEAAGAGKQTAEKTIQLNCSVPISSYVFSPDGKRAISNGDNSPIRLWDLETGRCVLEVNGKKGGVRCITWSADLSRALSLSESGAIFLWDMRTGRCLNWWKWKQDWVRSIAWANDQRHALLGGSGGGSG